MYIQNSKLIYIQTIILIFFIHQLINNRDKFIHLFIASSITKARECQQSFQILSFQFRVIKGKAYSRFPQVSFC